MEMENQNAQVDEQVLQLKKDMELLKGQKKQAELEFVRVVLELDAANQKCEQQDVQVKELETAKSAAANQLKSYLKEAEVGTVGNRKIIWKQVFKSTLDQKRLKLEKPDIYNGYVTESSYRRLSVA